MQREKKDTRDKNIAIDGLKYRLSRFKENESVLKEFWRILSIKQLREHGNGDVTHAKSICNKIRILNWMFNFPILNCMRAKLLSKFNFKLNYSNRRKMNREKCAQMKSHSSSIGQYLYYFFVIILNVSIREVRCLSTIAKVYINKN